VTRYPLKTSQNALAKIDVTALHVCILMVERHSKTMRNTKIEMLEEWQKRRAGMPGLASLSGL